MTTAFGTYDLEREGKKEAIRQALVDSADPQLAGEIAAETGISTKSIHALATELEVDGELVADRSGHRNTYGLTVEPPAPDERTARELIEQASDGADRTPTARTDGSGGRQ